MSFLHPPLQVRPWGTFPTGGLEVPLLPIHTPCLPPDPSLKWKGALPTNGAVESDSLEARLGTGLAGYSARDRSLCQSDATSASGTGFTAKCAEWEIHSVNASPM